MFLFVSTIVLDVIQIHCVTSSASVLLQRSAAPRSLPGACPHLCS